MDNPEYVGIVDRAEKRIEEAIEKRTVSFQSSSDDIEILSFPIAVMMIAYGNDQSLKKRYALAEAKRAYGLLRNEDSQKLVSLAQLFKWKIKPMETFDRNIQATTKDFAIDFLSYLRNTSIFHESKWKLVNRTMQYGEARVTKDEAARLLGEEVRAYIEKKLDQKIDFALAESVSNRVEKLRELYITLRGKAREEEMPKETKVDAFPPCINRLYQTALAKKHLSHIERFTLTSFLLNSGMPVENVIECFRPTSDFSEKLTRYQVEHIAGGRGSGTKYVPPKCSTLKTHQICPGQDEICERVRRPLAYYREKYRLISPQIQSK